MLVTDKVFNTGISDINKVSSLLYVAPVNDADARLFFPIFREVRILDVGRENEVNLLL